MLAKTILVMYLVVGRYETQIQYIVKFPTEAQCQAESAKYKSKAWEALPYKRAECVFDATQGVK